MPTGVPIPDVRDQLLAAAERLLLREGPDALTSRAVTAEAGLAKGILHRHFADFDTFLASLVLAHIERIEAAAVDLRASAGSGAVTDNVAAALADALSPAACTIIGLVCARRELLRRLRLTTPVSIPLLAETTRQLASYLTAERGLGRIAVKMDVDLAAVMLVGGAYLLCAGADAGPRDSTDLRALATATLGVPGVEHSGGLPTAI